MSKIERLTKDHPDLSVNMIRLLRKFDPSDSGKFLPFLIKHGVESIQTFNKNVMEKEVNHTFNLLAPDATPIEKFLLYVLYVAIGHNKLYALWELHKHLEAQRIEENDVSKYKSWDDIFNGVMLAELKVKEKELQKQIKVVYDDGEWLIIKPLSLKASITYGAGTRWCTASRHEPRCFYDYSSRGVLIYIINRKTNYKFAMFVDLNPQKSTKDIEISFWTAQDVRTESMEIEAPNELMTVLRNHIHDRTQLKPNKCFFSKDELKNLHMAVETTEPMTDIPRHVDAEAEVIVEDRGGIVGYENENAIERVVNYDEAEDVAIVIDGMAQEADDGIWRRAPHQHNPIPPRPQVRISQNIAEAMVALNHSVAQERQEHAEELRVEIMGNDDEVVEEQAEQIDHPNTMRAQLIDADKIIVRKNISKPTEYKLGPGVQPLDVDGEFIPAPWLTQEEIKVITKILRNNQYQIQKVGWKNNFYAYPNGRIISVTDRIEDNTIIDRRIEEIRIGRNQNEPLNPFSIMRGEIVIDTNDILQLNAPMPDEFDMGGLNIVNY